MVSYWPRWPDEEVDIAWFLCKTLKICTDVPWVITKKQMDEVFCIYLLVFDLDGSEYTALSSKYMRAPKNGENKKKNIDHTFCSNESWNICATIQGLRPLIIINIIFCMEMCSLGAFTSCYAWTEGWAGFDALEWFALLIEAVPGHFPVCRWPQFLFWPNKAFCPRKI